MNQKNHQKPSPANNNSGGSLRERLEQELTEELPREFIEQITGRPDSAAKRTTLERGNSLNLKTEKQPQPKEKVTRHRLQQQLEQETSLRLREKQTVQAEISRVREEIQRLAETINTAQNKVEKTVIAAQNTPEKADSQYHVNFLQSLLKFLKNLRKNLRQQIGEGEIWLQAFQERHQKKNPFWNQVKKSGAKFLLAPDRTPSTQAA